jgi:hypothetical protein
MLTHRNLTVFTYLVLKMGISCMQRTFDHDDKLKTSVDAALVLLQNNWTMDPNDYILDGACNSCPFSKLGM